MHIGSWAGKLLSQHTAFTNINVISVLLKPPILSPQHLQPRGFDRGRRMPKCSSQLSDRLALSWEPGRLGHSSQRAESLYIKHSSSGGSVCPPMNRRCWHPAPAMNVNSVTRRVHQAPRRVLSAYVITSSQQFFSDQVTIIPFIQMRKGEPERLRNNAWHNPAQSDRTQVQTQDLIHQATLHLDPDGLRWTRPQKHRRPRSSVMLVPALPLTWVDHIWDLGLLICEIGVLN